MKALVTGASTGIGRELAKYLSGIGYDLIIIARDEGKLISLKEEVDTNVEIIATDLSNSQNCMDLYNRVKNEDIDILVNNAGFGIFGEFADTKLDKEIGLINTNITAVHILTKLFLKDMIKKDSGYILNVSSVASFAPGPMMSAYYASKAYITRLSQGIYKELKKQKTNVHISILCPGPVDTHFNKTAGVQFTIKPLSSEYVAKYAIDKMFKKKLIILPGSMAKLMRFLAKISPDNLSSEVTYRNQKRKAK